MGRGTLEACADIVAELMDDERRSLAIQMDEIDLRFDREDVEGVLRFLQAGKPGLTDNEIAKIKS